MSAEPGQQHARTWQRWAFAALPAVGLLELTAQVLQSHSAPPAHDWKAARDYVAAQVRPDDLIVFAPSWTDPLGREFFGPSIATVEREARPDESRFPRALEVSLRGAHLPALGAWRQAEQQRFGRVVVTTLENPTPSKVLDDLVTMVSPERLRVAQVQGSGEVACGFVRTSAQSGGLGFGPAIPAQRFACPSGAFVGVSVVADLDYVPRRCLYAPPNAAGALRVRFLGVRFGRTLHGHHALYVEAERSRQGSPVGLVFTIGGALLGRVEHRDGEGWKPFEFDTAEHAGTQADLVAEVSSSGERRLYCFEAVTR